MEARFIKTAFSSKNDDEVVLAQWLTFEDAQFLNEDLTEAQWEAFVEEAAGDIGEQMSAAVSNALDSFLARQAEK